MSDLIRRRICLQLLHTNSTYVTNFSVLEKLVRQIEFRNFHGT